MKLSDISNKEQTLDEASLATMRDYFAGQEDARDPLEITKQRMWFDKNKDKLANKRKEFRSTWEFNQWLKQHKLKALSDGSIVKEFAPSNGGDDGEEDTLLKYARMWYNGDLGTQQQVEQVLARMGWEIGELESEEGGAFVVQSGDENGDSYIGFAPADLTEARRANTASARAEFSKRTKKPTLSPAEQDKKNADSDEAWARLMAYADEQKKKEQGVTEMDSQGYTGSRDRKSMSKYGSRDDYELGDPETTLGPDSIAKPADVVKQGAKALDNAFNYKKDDWSDDFERRMKKGNKIGEQSNYSPMVKDTMQADKIRSLKNLIAIAKEQGRRLRVQELERELKKLQGVAESSGNIGSAIKSLYQKIYNAGDDEIEYFYHDSPIFAQYWDEYEGDLNSIIAEVDPEELQIIHDELESYVQQANLAEAHPNSKIYDKCWDGHKKVPGKKRGEAGSCVKESTSALSKAIQLVEEDRMGTFSAVMIHETTPEAAKQILQNGFKPSFNGIFFNVQGQNYSGGGYGGVSIRAKITGPANDILDLENDEDLPEDLEELADGEEIAEYARNEGYWAWTDGVQFAVLDPKHIQVQGINEGMRSVREGEPGIKRVTRKRVDDSTEVRYHVIDSDGVTRKVFDDLGNAKRWLSANRDILSKD